MRRSLTAIVLVAALASLSGCGKGGRPVTPPDTQYPRPYPSPTLGPAAAPTPAKQKEGRALPPEWDQQDLDERYTPPPAKKDQFTANGNYIDPSVRTPANPAAQVMPGSNLPNTVTSGPGADIFSRGLGAPNPSPLPEVQPSTTEAPE